MMDINTFLQYLFEGDFLGAWESIYLSSFLSYYELFYVILALIFIVPIYIRTQSLTLVSLLWIVAGSLIMVAMPMVSIVSFLFLALGLGGMFYQLYMSRSPY